MDNAASTLFSKETIFVMESSIIHYSLVIILIAGIGCQWVSSLTRIPSILLLLLVGVILGPISGVIQPDRIFGDLLSSIVSLSVAIILFEGGMSLNFRDIKDSGLVISNLVTFGAAASAISTFILLYYLLDYSFAFSLIQSVILVITGPTVVTPMLNQLHVKKKVRTILKWEGIVIDPIGAISAVIVLEALLRVPHHTTAREILLSIISSMTIGLSFGLLGAALLVFSIRKFLISDTIESPVTLMLLFAVYTLSNGIHLDSGLIAVTVMGFILGNQSKAEVHHILNFKESLTVILISFLFITLAGTINATLLWENAMGICLLLAFLIFVARPLTVLFSGAFWLVEPKEALFMCCIAPRGIVTAAMASLFSIELLKVGYEDAVLLTPVTFGVIVGSVVFYSLFTPLAARILGVSASTDKKVIIIGANTLAREIARILIKEEFELQLIDPDFWKVSATKRSDLPVFAGTFLEYTNKFLEEMDSTDLVLALTENDDINSLAILHFRRYFNDAQLYQLPTKGNKIKESQMGQQLFGTEHSFTSLTKQIAEGSLLKSTRLTKNFTFKEWQEKHESKATLLFEIKKGGRLAPQTDTHPLSPKDSGKIIYLT